MSEGGREGEGVTWGHDKAMGERKDGDVFGAGQRKQKHISCFYDRTVSRRILVVM